MKRAGRLLILFSMVFCCFAFAGCSGLSHSEQEQSLTVYSFSGKNEYFSISNGVIVLTPTEEIFYGGDLEEQREFFNDITDYSVTFYIISDNREKTLSSNSVVDETGGVIDISGWTGKIVGDILTNTDIEYLTNNLYCKLQTVNLNGEESDYLLQLTVTEITEQ